jgi:hypothetical protein
MLRGKSVVRIITALPITQGLNLLFPDDFPFVEYFHTTAVHAEKAVNLGRVI